MKAEKISERGWKHCLARRVALKHRFGFGDTLKIINAFLAELVHELLNGQAIRIRGFGKFEVVERKVFIGMRMRPGQKPIRLSLPRRELRKRLKFTPGKRIKDLLLEQRREIRE